jgi:hypothetical protein
MGQRITVTSRAGASPRVRIFDCNRTLTGQEITRFPTAESASSSEPPAVLARRLFTLGASSVSIFSNVVTVDAEPAAWDTLLPQAEHAIEHLFEYYGDEAGWSPDALTAMGITVRTPKETVAE